MKLWKKIVLVVSTLIVVISSMVLPVFANDYVPEAESNYKTGYKYNASLLLNRYGKDVMYTLPSDYIVKQDSINRPNQAFYGEMIAYPMRNSEPEVNADDTLAFTGVLYNRIMSGNTETDGDRAVEYRGIHQYGTDSFYNDEIDIIVENFIYNKKSVKQILLEVAKRPDQLYEDYWVDIKVNIKEPVYDVDTGEISYLDSSVSYHQKIFEELPNSTIPILRPDLIYPSGVYLKKNGQIIEYETENDEGYVYIESVTAHIYNKNEEVPAYAQRLNFDYFSLTLPFGNQYSNQQQGIFTGVAPDDYYGYSEYLNRLYKDERKVIQPVTFDADFWSFIETSIDGFFDFELLPNLSIGGIFMTLIAILLFIIILKVFAGG